MSEDNPWKIPELKNNIYPTVDYPHSSKKTGGNMSVLNTILMVVLIITAMKVM